MSVPLYRATCLTLAIIIAFVILVVGQVCLWPRGSIHTYIAGLCRLLSLKGCLRATGGSARRFTAAVVD